MGTGASTKSNLQKQNSASSTSAVYLKTSSYTHSFNISERFCGDPLCLEQRLFHKSDSKISRCRSYKSVSLQYTLRIDETSHRYEFNNIVNTSDACDIAYNIDFENPLHIVNQAANEIRVIGREQGQAHTAQEMGNGLLGIKEKGEQATLEYCIKLYTKASFLYRACHHDLADNYSIDDRQLFNYTKLLNLYINRYGKSYIGTVYRGALLTNEKLKLYLTNDIDSKWYSPTYLSTSKSRNVAEIYGNVLIIINIQKSDRSTEKAVDISELSVIPDEEEILLTPKYLLSKMKQSEFDPILKKHIIYLTSATRSIIPFIQNNNYDYRSTKRKRNSNDQKCKRFSSTPEDQFKETDSSSDNESNHCSCIVSDEQSTKND